MEPDPHRTSCTRNSRIGFGPVVLAAGMILSAALGGCATYVNIPPQTGDLARHDPNLSAVRKIQITALRGMFSEDPIETTYQVILPRGTSPAQYNVLLQQLNDDLAMWSIKGPRDGIAHFVFHTIRVRGWYAQVDIIRPASFRQPDGPRQLATIWLHWYPFTGWTYNRKYLWSIGVEEAVREAALNMQP